MWAIQNLGLPLVPWLGGFVVGGLILNRIEWQLMGFSVYAITVTLIAFSMGNTIGHVTEIIPGELDGENTIARSACWYVGGLAFAILFAVYDVLAVEEKVHHWFWGRAVDLFVLSLGAIMLMRAFAVCKALKLDRRGQ
jgi:hypothetical protein